MVTTSGGRRAGKAGVEEQKASHVRSRSAAWEDIAGVAGVRMIPLRGVLSSGPNACFSKFEPGVDHGWHTHTHDVAIVVIEGAYLFKAEGGEEQRVAAGDYFFIPGGLKHWSGGDRAQGCVFYQESPDSFDFNPIE